MATPLANFFTRIGFEVDKSSIRDVEKNLERLESRIKSMANSFQSITNAPAVRAATRLANAEARRITAEMNLNKQNMSVEKLKQQNIRDNLKLTQKQQGIKDRVVLESQKARQRMLDFAHGQALREDYRRTKPTTTPQSGGTASPFFTTDKVNRIIQLEAARRFVQSSFRVGNFQTSQMPQYEFLTGSTEGAQQSISYVNKLVDDLKLNLQETNAQFVQFLGATKTTIGVEKTQQTFRTLQTFGVMMGATGDQLKRGTKAVQQMLSKQKLSAEELTGQMAEANLIPGATQVFADVLEGGDVKKLFENMKKGKYELQDIVNVLDSLQNKINKDQLDKMLQRPTAELTELATAWQRFLMEVNEGGGLAIMKAVLDTATDGVNLLRKLLKPLGQIFKQTWGYVKDLYNLLYTLFDTIVMKLMFGSMPKALLTMGAFALSFKYLAAAVRSSSAAMLFLGKVATGLKVAGIAAFILLLDDLIVTLQGGDSVLGDLAKGGGWPAILAKTLIGLGHAVEFVLGNFIALFHGIFNGGDWSYFTEVWRKFGEDLNNLMPFDKWMYQLKQLGKLLLATAGVAINPMDVGAYERLFKTYNSFQGSGEYYDQMLKYNAASAAKAPVNLARQNPNVTTHMNVTIPINGTGLDPQAISKAVAEQLNITFMQSQSNYVMRNGAK